MTIPVSTERTAIRCRATAKAVSTRVPKRARSIASWVKACTVRMALIVSSA